MRFRLKGWLEFSSSIEAGTDEVAKLIEDANSRLLVKGSPSVDEAARVESWKVEGKRLYLEVVSGKGVRAHDGLLRLRKHLAQALGLKLRAGLRKVFVESLEVILAKPSLSLEEARSKLKGVAEVEALEGGLFVVFRGLGESELEGRVVDRALRMLMKAEELEAGAKLVPYGYVLRSSAEKPMLFTGEVAQEAERLGWIKRFPARGQWILTGPMTALISSLRDILIDEICKPLGFQEWIFPRLLPFTVLERLSAYVEHLPEGMFYVCSPPRDPKAFDDFKREFALRRELRADLLKEVLEPPSYVMDAVQCPPFYQFFSGELVRVEDLPVKVYEWAGGWTWRNEAGGVEGLARTNEFLRLEMVYLGTPDQVVEIRDEVVERTIEVLDKVLDLEWRLSVGAPFYLSQEAARERLVDISSSSKIPALDVECYLPYRGSRESSEWLEVSSCNVHGRHYVDSFRIREARGREIWTGCVGHGLTRWATAFLAQKGFNFEDWPKEVRERIGVLPPAMETLTWPRAARGRDLVGPTDQGVAA